jgi:hypothetical protein
MEDVVSGVTAFCRESTQADRRMRLTIAAPIGAHPSETKTKCTIERKLRAILLVFRKLLVSAALAGCFTYFVSGFLGGQVRLKQLGPERVKAFGKVTLGPTLGAIGCKLLLVEDAEATAKIRARARTRHSE